MCVIAGISERGTFSLSMPHSLCCVGGQRDPPLLLAPAPPAACRANRCRARSSRRRARAAPTGANGRNPSRNLILMFICACIRGLRGSPRMLRAPRARGPNSIRPSNQPTIFSSARAGATRSDSSAARPARRYAAPADFRKASISCGENAGPEIRALHRVVWPLARPRHACMCRWCDELRHAERAARVAGGRLNPDAA